MTTSVWPITSNGPFLRAFDSGDEIRPVRIQSKGLRRNTFSLQNVLDILHCGKLVTRRVGRVEPKQRLIVTYRFFLDTRPVRLGILRNSSETEKDQDPRARNIRFKRVAAERSDPSRLS